ncbi:MAG: T9SS type A sorting domain-containing protein, partial [Saprospiraceae bacterium]|nr:T9SS type A sorting domain-containing protein [Saprospiraceae bacterium]
MNTVGRFQAFSYACDDPLAANSIFISYKFNHSFDDIFRSDSSYYSIYIDPDIGNPKDDYLGTGKDFLYAYNSDTLQDEILDVHPPMLGIHFLKGPMDTFGNYISLSHVMPMVFDTNLIQAINPPEHDVEYYRYMSGSWKDGLPLNSGDFGYSNDSIVNFPFPDHPTNSLGWSELAAQNPLADRRAVASFGPTTLLTGSTNHLLVGLYASNEVGPTSQLEEMQKRKQLFTWHFNGGWHSYDKPVYLCPNPNSAFLYKRPLLAIVKLFPNPAKESFRVAVFGHWLLHVSICDQHQRVIYEQDLESLDFEFSTKGLPPGIYFVNCVLSNGERIIEKVIVNL